MVGGMAQGELGGARGLVSERAVPGNDMRGAGIAGVIQ
jgi:hypothetical protein